MINNLMITSNGFNDAAPRSPEIDAVFEKMTSGKKVLIIGNAAKVSNFDQREVVKRNFEGVGAYVDLVDLDESNVSIIQNYDVCYGIGGDVSELLKLVYQTTFKEELITFLQNGGLYIGESAGSMILGPNLEETYKKNRKFSSKPKWHNYQGPYDALGFIPYVVIPHFEMKSEEEKQAALAIGEIPLVDGEFRFETFGEKQPRKN